MLYHLHQYIGLEIDYNGTQCQLIEILEDGPALVFMCMGQGTTIQTDQHGGAHRRVHETYTIPCISEIRDELHPVVKQILPDDIHTELLEFLLEIRD
ncbi:MAG: hypothetical protein OEY89_00625 [Gammaproteobacteria bacterium]|nr:hypothetical protein [Gammaproteobacteria bacterium]